MIQDILLVILVILCITLIISLFKNPFERVIKNPCMFKILSPMYSSNGNNRNATFEIIVEKKHRYFINFPLAFRFYSSQNFKTYVKISYLNPYEKEEQSLVNRLIDFTGEMKEHIVYINDIFVGVIMIEINLEVQYGNPIIEFQILKNSTCDMIREHKLQLKF